KTCFPINGVLFFDSCTGEWIFVTGQDCVDFYIHTDASGGQHVTYRETIEGSGVGMTSGTQYEISEVSNGTENLNDNNLQHEFIAVFHLNLISKGSMPNERIKATTHFTVDANGNVTVDRVDLSDDCRG